jgi:hypothetical protein
MSSIDALDLAEAMLDYIYVLTAKFNEFKSRRASAASVAVQTTNTTA